jgi:hypothetical protein
MLRMDINRVFHRMAKTVKATPVAVGGIAGDNAIFFTHQYRKVAELTRLKPGNAVVGIDGFIVPDSGGVDYRMVINAAIAAQSSFVAKRIDIVAP